MAFKTREEVAMAKAKSESKAVMKWDEQLAKQAAESAKMEQSAGGGAFFSTKGGVLTWQDAPLKDNQMAVIILDSVFETTLYADGYDPDNPASPIAFAFGRDDTKLTWHETSVKPYAGTLCKESEECQWGSAEKGRGKKAKETRRLAMIPAGQFVNNKFKLETDEDHFTSTPIGYMRLPVTSVRPYAGFVKQVAGALSRPPHGIITKVKVQPDPKNQYMVIFEAIQNVPDDLMGMIMKRHEEARAAIEFPYEISDDEPKAAKGKTPAKAKAKRKY
jgi:hypothetical protein